MLNPISTFSRNAAEPARDRARRALAEPHRDGRRRRPRTLAGNSRGSRSLILAAGLIALLAITAGGGAPPAAGIELCSPEARALMRKAEIAESKIEQVCRAAAEASALLTLSVRREEDELGYCHVTLALHNNSTQYLNQLALASADGRFGIFQFQNVMAGRVGFASARSRILLACDELPEVGILLRWPASLRIGDRSPAGRRLHRYKPLLLDGIVRWKE